MYADESQIPQNYGIQNSNLYIYLIVALVLIIPQLIVNIFLLHSTEIVQGVKLFDYFTFAAFRYKTRTTSWFSLHNPLDRSIASDWRSLDQTCFSSQFYFAVSTCTWGIMMNIFGLITMFNNSYSPFADPFLSYFITITFFAAVAVSYVLRLLRKMAKIWEINRRDPERRGVRLGICPLDHFNSERILLSEMHNELFKHKFLSTNKEWLIHNLAGIIENEGEKGKSIYQKIINEGARQEELKNNDAKGRRNKALLPFRTGGDDEVGKLPIKKEEKLQMSMIVPEEDQPPNYAIDAKQFENNKAPFRIFKKWHEKALELRHFRELVADIHKEKMRGECRICRQTFKLYVFLLIPFEQIFYKYQREMIGIHIDPDHWKAYYRRHQQFRTICEECGFVNSVMQSKYEQYKYKIMQDKKGYWSRILSPGTFRLIHVWHTKAVGMLNRSNYA